LLPLTPRVTSGMKPFRRVSETVQEGLKIVRRDDNNDLRVVIRFTVTATLLRSSATRS
jgi:hypothetical protein